MKMSGLDRIMLLLTGLLAAYQVSVGIEGLGVFAITAYTVAFGVLLVAGLLMIILGFSALDSPIVVVVSTIIPLSLSLGMVWDYFTFPDTVFPIHRGWLYNHHRHSLLPCRADCRWSCLRSSTGSPA